MPIQMTTLFNAGDIDGELTHAKIIEFTLLPDSKMILVTTRLGVLVNGNFVQKIAIEDKTVKRFTIEGQDYDTMVASASSASGEVYYEKVSELLYNWLLDNGKFTGTIV